MRIIRFIDDHGVAQFGSPRRDGTAELLSGGFADGFHRTGGSARIARLLAPSRGSILGIGCNYRRLAALSDKPPPSHPVTYFSLPNAHGDPDAPVSLPSGLAHQHTKYEGELVAVIGRRIRDVPRHQALAAVFGYTIGNDLTTNDWTGPAVGNQWCKGKGFDGYKPTGPCIISRDEIPDPQALHITTTLNGTVVQDESCMDMIHDVATCVSFLSQGHTIEPGDLIFTGTPFGLPGNVPGARWLQAGDIVRVSIDPIGALETVIASPRSGP